jgi:hypothetical protein
MIIDDDRGAFTDIPRAIGPGYADAISGFSRSELLEEAIKYSVTAKLSQWDTRQEETRQRVNSE